MCANPAEISLRERSRCSICWHLLQAPYNALRNYDQFLAALRQQVTPEEAEVWCVYPDYTLTVSAKTPDEVLEDVRPGLRTRLAELSQSMARKGFLLEDTTPSGQTGYIRTYFYEIASRLIYHPDGTSLAEAFLHWWIDVVDGGDSAKLRESYPEYRVLPHEGALTGDSRHGKIPMNLEIPDTREILAGHRLCGDAFEKVPPLCGNGLHLPCSQGYGSQPALLFPCEGCVPDV